MLNYKIRKLQKTILYNEQTIRTGMRAQIVYNQIKCAHIPETMQLGPTMIV